MNGLAPAPTTTPWARIGSPPRMRARYSAAAGLDGAHRRLLHVVRRREVGLADAEADDVLSLARERGHLGEHDERVLGAQARGAAADLRHKTSRKSDCYVAP